LALAYLGDLCLIAGLLEENTDMLGVEVIGQGRANRHNDHLDVWPVILNLDLRLLGQ
jgi:hypothetical protein